MKGRTAGVHYLRGTPSDLLVCFPTRAQLALLPMPICSPSRPIDISRHPSSRPAPNRSLASPLSQAKMVKHISPELDEEPMSPEVSCAGQIKVRPKSQPISQGFLSTKKKQSWLDVLGLKRDILQFFAGRPRFNMGCLGSTLNYTSDEEEEVSSTQSGSVLSKWFMMLDEESKDRGLKDDERELSAVIDQLATAPPAKALFLMRCRSAPAKANEWSKGWGEEGGGEMMMTSTKRLREEEKGMERLVLMSCAPDFFEATMDIVKKTWVGGPVDPLARCRSWKRRGHEKAVESEVGCCEGKQI